MSALAEDLCALGLRYAGEHLDDLIALATKKRLSPVQFLEHLVAQEAQDKAQKSLERRLTRSRIGRFRPMADFDWAWPKRIDRSAVESALALDFLGEARNVVLVAPQGLGKTMIAQNIAYQAVLAGHSVLFVTAAQLLLDLGSTESARALDRRLKRYSRFHLLCIDELGYLSYDNRNADLLLPCPPPRRSAPGRPPHHRGLLPTGARGRGAGARCAEQGDRDERAPHAGGRRSLHHASAAGRRVLASLPPRPVRGAISICNRVAFPLSYYSFATPNTSRACASNPWQRLATSVAPWQLFLGSL